MKIWSILIVFREKPIDGLRGILASTVAIGHIAKQFGTPSILDFAISSLFPVAVSFFAVLSGYVLCAGFEGQRADVGLIKSFYIRRVLRPYPLYILYFVITCAGVVGIMGVPSVRTWIRLFSDLFMLDVLQFGWKLSSPTWSLYPEVIFSIGLPIWYLFFGGTRSWLGAAITYLILAVFSWAATPLGPSTPTFVILRYFFLGIVLSHVVAFLKAHSSRAMEFVLPCAFLLGCVLLLAFGRWQPHFLTAALSYYSRIGISFHQDFVIVLLFIPIVASSAISFFFSFKPLVFLGLVSYGIYILHIPLMFVSFGDTFVMQSGSLMLDKVRVAPGLEQFGIVSTFISVVIIAWICHILIERPGIAYGRKLTEHHGAVPAIVMPK